MARKSSKTVPKGCIYKRGGRWWYKVNIGRKPNYFPLVPRGKKMATPNREVAQLLARNIYRRYFGDTPGKTLKSLVGSFRRGEELTGVTRHVEEKVRVVEDFCKALNIKEPAEITPAAIQEYMTILRQRGLKPKTIANARANLGRFCQHLLLHDELARNPVRATRPPKVPQKEPHHLSAEEIDLIAKEAKKRNDLAVSIAVYTGLRIGSIAKLRWGNYQDTKDGPILVAETKSNRPHSVPVNKRLQAILNAHKKRRGALFPTWTRRTWGRKLQPYKNIVPNLIGWHDFRRTLATRLVQNGEDIYTVMQILGHTDIRTTQRHYAHLRPGSGRKGLDRL